VTVKEPDNVPLEIEQLGELTTLPDSEQPESLEEKLEPETCTVVPAGPEVGLSTIDREPVTVKTAEAESPIGLPVTVIVYAAAGTLATMNEAVIDPSIIEQVSDSIEPPSDSEHVESLDENPDP
jgi:hypothetical protein